jgi:alpha-mannosidase
MIKKISAILTAMVGLLMTGLYAQKTAKHFTSVTLEPTIAYINYNGADRRMARLLFRDGKSFKEGEAIITFNGETTHVKIPASPEGMVVFELPLPGPPIQITTQAEVILQSGDQTYKARCLVAPARNNWTVYILPHSHVDIGYTNTQAKVLKLHMDNIDAAIDLAEKTADYPVGARYKWTTEAIWVVDNMQIFIRSQQLAREHDIEINTMFQGDVPGASWGLATQSEQTGIKYFLSGPNASDRIGNLAKWQDKPFYWMSPSGKQRFLFWQCQPYSIGYTLKGSKIPNFFSVDDPKPYYTGHPSENFLNPYLFSYLADLEQNRFPYDMTILTWAMSDNAPIDPELPDAVKAWNQHFSSPKLVITSVKQFFGDFEGKYKSQIPHLAGDYTEYWTDGVSSAARETALSRESSDRLKQVAAIWASRNETGYPADKFNAAWKNLLLYNEHTWGAYNSVDEPDNEKVKSEWAVKQGYVLQANRQIDTLMQQALHTTSSKPGAIAVYNTLSWARTGIVYVAPSLSATGDLVKDENGARVPSQRLSTGELAFVATDVPQFGNRIYTIHPGKAYSAGNAKITNKQLTNGIYTIDIEQSTGDIDHITKNSGNKTIILVDSAGFNKYLYMPGDSLKNLQSSSEAHISIKENGPLVVSLLITSRAPGANSLVREVKLVSGIDQIELINTIDKIAVRQKESVHFAFPFHVPAAQVHYSIPWGSITAEADQLPNANKNWYTVQRWVDVSNADYGVTWSSPDAPLFEIGDITTAGLLGGLHHSPLWLTFTPQSPTLYSWVINNLWHTNFRADQEGKVTFHYLFKAHDQSYDSFSANQEGLNDHQPLIVADADQGDSQRLFFKLSGEKFYVESIKPANDGKGVIAQLVSCGPGDSKIQVSPQNVSAVRVYESDLMEDKKQLLGNNFILPSKEIMTVRIEKE